MNFQQPSHSSSGQLASEITRNVKQRFHTPNESPYKGTKIKTRTDMALSFLRSEDHWRIAMERRNEQASMGLFSPANQPYNEIGKVEMNTKRLVFSKMQELGSITRSRAEGSLLPDKETLSSRTKRTPELSNEKDEDKTSTTVKATEVGIPKRKYEDNGVSKIKKLLECAENRIIAVKAGQPLSTYLDNEKRAQVKLDMNRQEREYNPRARGEMVSLEITKNASSREENAKDNEEKRITREPDGRTKMEFLAKLDCIRTVLCCLLNMKTTELRSRVPLPADALRSIKKDVDLGSLINLNIQSNKGPKWSNLPAIIHISYKDHRFLNKDDQIQDLEGFLNIAPKLPQAPSIILDGAQSNSKPYVQLTDGFGKSTSLFPARNVNWPIQASSGDSRSIPSCKGSKTVDTWDDLMIMHCKETGNDGVSEAEVSRSPADRVSFQNQRNHVTLILKPKRGAVLHNKVVSDLPPWQKVIYEEARRDEMKSKKNLKGQTKDDPYSCKKDAFLIKVQRRFNKSRKKGSDKLNKELDKRLNCFQERMKFLEISHFAQEDLKAMRRRVKDYQQEVQTNLAKPSQWFEELSEEQRSLGLDADELVGEKINAIDFFTQIEFSKTSSFKAKLCLLLMSLPVYELCVIPMQKAIKFVLSSVLEVADGESKLKEWMQNRKLIKDVAVSSIVSR